MALMYLAKSPLKPDVTRDFYLSPILAPQVILAQFPKTFIMCGEKDPLVDDSGTLYTLFYRVYIHTDARTYSCDCSTHQTGQETRTSRMAQTV